MSQTSGPGRFPTVVGRAYRDEPIKLMAVSDWGRAIEVRREGDRDSIGFRKEWLYRFEPKLFDQLVAAFKAGDYQGLIELWSTAERLRSIRPVTSRISLSDGLCQHQHGFPCSGSQPPDRPPRLSASSSSPLAANARIFATRSGLPVRTINARSVGPATPMQLVPGGSP